MYTIFYSCSLQIIERFPMFPVPTISVSSLGRQTVVSFTRIEKYNTMDVNSISFSPTLYSHYSEGSLPWPLCSSHGPVPFLMTGTLYRTPQDPSCCLSWRLQGRLWPVVEVDDVSKRIFVVVQYCVSRRNGIVSWFSECLSFYYK